MSSSDQITLQKISQHYDHIANHYEKLSHRRKYYESLRQKQYRFFIPKGKKILAVGCSSGDLLASLEPSIGVGIDLSPKMIELGKSKYPHLQFVKGTIDHFDSQEKFDYIILPVLVEDLLDIESFFNSLRKFCTSDTRIIIEYHSYLWQLILKAAEKCHLTIPRIGQNWLTEKDIINFLNLSNFENIRTDRAILLPVNIWGISYVINKFLAKLPLFNGLTLSHFIIARPQIELRQDYSVTILVPCRNEKGNIESAITRTPEFGKHQEFIFVEGHSKDGTYEEVERVMSKYPHKDIKLFRQQGKGKGDAVRLGFSHATCDILMILDADLTVPPEELPKFYHAIQTGKGEFINGCRLVYPMEDEAMRFLNLIANKFFGLFFSWLLGQRFKDTLCGTKVILRHHYTELAANRHYFGDFDPFGDFDLIFGAIKQNLKVVEVPIRYKNRQYGTTQIQRFRHGLLLFKMCGFAMKKIKFL